MAYTRCSECDAPILRAGQTRKSIDDYRHLKGCSIAASDPEQRRYAREFEKRVKSFWTLEANAATCLRCRKALPAVPPRPPEGT